MHSVAAGDISENHRFTQNLCQKLPSYVTREVPKGFWIISTGFGIIAIPKRGVTLKIFKNGHFY